MLPIHDNLSRQSILELLINRKLNYLDDVLLTHLLNVVTNGLTCSYYGRFYDELSTFPNRCLASELRNGKVVCPFYNENALDKCNYNNKNLDRK